MNNRKWNGTSMAVSLHSVFTEYTCIQGEVFLSLLSFYSRVQINIFYFMEKRITCIFN